MNPLMNLLPAYERELLARDFSPKSVKTYHQYTAGFFAWLGERPLDRGAVIAYRDQRQAEGWRPRTLHLWKHALHGFFAWLTEEGHAAGLPDMKAVKAPRLDAPQRYVPTRDEVLRLFQAAEGMPRRTVYQRFVRGRALAVLSILAYAGLRRQELLDLEVSDLRPGWELRVRRGKGGTYRTVPLNAEAVPHLTAWLVAREAWLMARGVTENPALFIGHTGGESLGAQALMRLFADLRDRAGIGEHLTPHSLRHFAASVWARTQGVDVSTISELMGHSTVATTFTYLHPDATSKRRAVDGVSLTSGTAPEPVSRPSSQPRTDTAPVEAWRQVL